MSDDPLDLLPHEAKELRKYFKREQIVKSKEGDVYYEVAASEVTISTHVVRKGFPGSGDICVIMYSKEGVTLHFPVDRKLLKRLKREFEQEESWRKRLRNGDSAHSHQIQGHNVVSGNNGPHGYSV